MSVRVCMPPVEARSPSEALQVPCTEPLFTDPRVLELRKISKGICEWYKSHRTATIHIGRNKLSKNVKADQPCQLRSACCHSDLLEVLENPPGNDRQGV
jgi:hypothetical protein